MPVAEVNVDLPSVLPRVCIDGVSCPFDLLTGTGIEKYASSVSSDDDAIVKRLTQVMLELPGIEALGQRSGVVLLAQVNLQTPVVVHRVSLPPSTRQRFIQSLSV